MPTYYNRGDAIEGDRIVCQFIIQYICQNGG